MPVVFVFLQLSLNLQLLSLSGSSFLCRAMIHELVIVVLPIMHFSFRNESCFSNNLLLEVSYLSFCGARVSVFSNVICRFSYSGASGLRVFTIMRKFSLSRSVLLIFVS